jgi:hypothetical protein
MIARFLLVALFVSACGKTTSDTVLAKPLSAWLTETSSPTGRLISIYIGNDANLCTRERPAPNDDVIVLSLALSSTIQDPVGTYAHFAQGGAAVQDGFFQALVIHSEFSSCSAPRVESQEWASHGSLKIDALSSAQASGSYALTMPDGNTRSGVFHADLCGNPFPVVAAQCPTTL